MFPMFLPAHLQRTEGTRAWFRSSSIQTSIDTNTGHLCDDRRHTLSPQMNATAFYLSGASSAQSRHQGIGLSLSQLIVVHRSIDISFFCDDRRVLAASCTLSPQMNASSSYPSRPCVSPPIRYRSHTPMLRHSRTIQPHSTLRPTPQPRILCRTRPLHHCTHQSWPQPIPRTFHPFVRTSVLRNHLAPPPSVFTYLCTPTSFIPPMPIPVTLSLLPILFAPYIVHLRLMLHSYSACSSFLLVRGVFI